MSQWTTLWQRIAGKWQLPLAAVSAVALPASMTLLRPDPNKITLEEAATAMEQFAASGLNDDAIRLGQFMVSRGDCEGVHCATIELNLARALFGRAASSEVSQRNGKEVVSHYKRAAMRNANLSAVDLEQFAQALEWEGQYLNALQWYEEAIAKGHPRGAELRQHVIVLLRDKLGAATQQVSAAVDDFLSAIDEDRLDLRLWGIREKLYLLDDQGRPELGEKLLERNAPSFEHSDLFAEFQFLRMLVLYKTNRFDEAEVGLRALRNSVPPLDEVNAMAGWLLGKTVMYDAGPQRPMEALSFFRDVERLHPESPYAVASRLGSAEAFVLLERHDEAIAAYRHVLEELDGLDDAGSRLVNRDLLRSSLGVAAERRRADGDVEAAVSYAELAATLIDGTKVEQTVSVLQQLANLQAAIAQKWEAAANNRAASPPGSDSQRPDPLDRDFSRMYGKAADTYARIADLDLSNDRRSADAEWQAAELSAKAGRRRQAIKRFRAFVTNRPQSELVPRGLLRIGNLLQAGGRLDEAIEAYRDCYRRFPQTLDGIRTLIPLAQCYLLRSPSDLELAERTLQLVLSDSQVFTPDAPEFADALFMQGDVYGRQGRFEKSIATLEEAIQRYPEDPRVPRSRFLLADAYRRSALALREKALAPDFEGGIEQARAESYDRLSKASKLYRELIQDYENQNPDRLSALERVYLRHSYLYEADCYFEMQDYRNALRLYDGAIGMFKDSPEALSAYVQVINCHVFLGQTKEARAALARARVLTSSLRPEAFTANVSPEKKEDWKKYFDWLADSGVF